MKTSMFSVDVLDYSIMSELYTSLNFVVLLYFAVNLYPVWLQETIKRISSKTFFAKCFSAKLWWFGQSWQTQVTENSRVPHFRTAGSPQIHQTHQQRRKRAKDDGHAWMKSETAEGSQDGGGIGRVNTFSSTNSLKEQQNGEQSLQNNFWSLAADLRRPEKQPIVFEGR